MTNDTSYEFLRRDAAIALSFALRITEGNDLPGEPWEKAKAELMEEWAKLYRNGIVPQKPLKSK